MNYLRSYLFFLADMWCAAWDAALHVFDDIGDDDSDQTPTSGGTE